MTIDTLGGMMNRFRRGTALCVAVIALLATVLPTASAQPADRASDDLPFTDLVPGAFYVEPVRWAVANNITDGISPTEFGPRVTASRAQALTFLWRLNGEPEPEQTGFFDDVSDRAWFNKSAHWALEQGITYGIGGTAEAPTTTFAPSRPMTRAQFVALLWRLEGFPTTTLPAGFVDIPDTAFFRGAADWAAQRGIAAGDILNFNGANTLNRGQAVTFLKRFADNPLTDIDAPNYSGRGPFDVGLREETVTVPALASQDGPNPDLEVFIQLYYPVDASDVSDREPLTVVSSAPALGPPGSALRTSVENLASVLIQDLPVNFYPDAPLASSGPHPVVVSSHGAFGDPRYVADHLSHIASWGYIVMAPSHPQRNLQGFFDRPAGGNPIADVLAGLDLVDTLGNNPEDVFFGGVDTSAIAGEGHSAGAGTLQALVANDDRGPDVVGLIGHATAIRDLNRDVPVLLLPGERDQVIALPGIEEAYQTLAAPRQLIVLANAGHNPVLDICAPLRAVGGISQFPLLSFLSFLAEDGCLDGYTLPGVSTAALRHATVAQLQWNFGTDPTPAALSETFLRQQFPAAIGEVLTDLGGITEDN